MIDPEKEKMFESMEKPLTDYWIASSHNTYLEDDQLKGKTLTGKGLKFMIF